MDFAILIDDDGTVQTRNFASGAVIDVVNISGPAEDVENASLVIWVNPETGLVQALKSRAAQIENT